MKPLTIENFDVSDSFILDPCAVRYRLTLAKFVNLEMCKSLPLVRIDGNLKVFINKGKSFSLAILVDKSNEGLFKSLESTQS